MTGRGTNTAKRLTQLAPEILRRWEERARSEIRAAKHQSTLVLRNEFPVLLAEVARALSPGVPGEPILTSPSASQEHGAGRARLEPYTLAQVFHEYRLLRQAILEALETDERLSAHDVEVINDTLEQAVQDAGTHYALLKQEVERKRAEEAEAAQRFAESVVETVREPLLILDGKLRVYQANRCFYTVFRASPEDTVGRPVYELGNGQWNIPALRHLLEELLPKNTVLHDFEVEHDFPSIGRKVMVLNAHRLERLDGEQQRILLAIEDATERTDALRRLSASEEQARALAEELTEADRRKNEFLAILAHEFRTPLSAIRNALYTLEHSPGLDGRSVRQVEAAARQSRHLARLVEDLFDVSRIAAGKMELRRERVDLVRVTQQAVEAARPLLEAREHEFTGTLPSEPLWVDADPTRLEQVIMNLLTNAAKYTETGGHVTLTVRKENKEAVIGIRDTGVGIAPEMLPYIFEPFTQGAPSSQHAGGGLGLGLSLVRRLVELHGGTVTAHSAGPGQGAEFVVHLPL